MEEKDIEILKQQGEADVCERVANIIKTAKPEELELLLSDYHEKDIAQALPLLSAEQRAGAFAALSNTTLSDIFSYADAPSELVEEISPDKAADIIEQMAADDAVDLLDELDSDKKQELILLMEDEAAEDVKLIDAYDEELIGSLMTNDFVAINQSLSVKKAMRTVIAEAAHNENITTVFIIDDDGILKGAIKLRDLVIARADTPLDDIVMENFPYLKASDITADVLEDIKNYAEETLPVLDDDNRLIGALTSADVVEAVEEEIADDYAKLAGLTQEEEAGERFFSSALKRLPWLIALLILDLFIGAYVGIFEAIVIDLPFIVSFQQLISGMSGNAGTQTLAVTVRTLADADVTGRQKRTLVLRELRIGVLTGLATGLLAAIAVCLYAYFTGAAANLLSAAVTGGAVGLALLTSTVISSLMGTLIPLLFDKLKVDPAVASGPLITTVNDLTAITVYYGLALLLLL